MGLNLWAYRLRESTGGDDCLLKLRILVLKGKIKLDAILLIHPDKENRVHEQ